jgi:hypothetical protein
LAPLLLREKRQWVADRFGIEIKEHPMITNLQIQRPAAAALAPGLKTKAAGIGRAVWDTLHAIGAARARTELIRLAVANQITNPELAAHLRRVVREDWLTKG